MSGLKNKTLFITGSSRGIGLAIALRAAREGANIVVIGKTAEPHARLPGTIYTAAQEIERAGGHALPIALDIRFEEAVKAAVKQAVQRFGGIDILVNNASAISLTSTAETSIKRLDLMLGVNLRGTFVCSQACLPYLAQAANPHILTLSPPPDLNPKWFAPHVAYTIAKYGMSLCVLGMAEEFRPQGIAVNALWPRTTIATAALQMIPGAEAERGRTAEIVADAAALILDRPSRTCTGNFFTDEQVLTEAGVASFDRYAVSPGQPLQMDFFLD